MQHQYILTKSQKRRLWWDEKRRLGRALIDLRVQQGYNLQFINQITEIPMLYLDNLETARGDLLFGYLINLAWFYGKTLRIDLVDPPAGMIEERLPTIVKEPVPIEIKDAGQGGDDVGEA